MVTKITGAQRDFSYGEVDVALKRADEHPARKAGLRQMANARILNSGAVQNRSGRRALFPTTASRVEKITMSAGNNFKIAFGAGVLQIRSDAGAVLQTFTLQGNGATLLPWASQADINSIRYAIFNLTIVICFGHAMRPQVITWDGVSVWTIADYTEAILAGGQKRTPFYRISPQNITALPSAVTGNITVSFSQPIVVAGMAGTRILYCSRQILLGALISTSQINATVIEPLPPGQLLALTASVGNFAPGDVVEGSTSGAQGIVTGSPSIQSIQTTTIIFGNLQVGDTVTGGTSGATGVVTAIYGSSNPLADQNFNVSLSSSTAFVAAEVISGAHGSVTSNSVSAVNMTVQLIQNAAGNLSVFFSTSDTVVGPSGHAGISSTTTEAPQPVSVWDDEIMNSFRGFPASVFVDQFRLGFCNFPAVPGGLSWSSINSPTDLYVGANPSDAMFEIAPGKVQIFDVVAGPESSEFVFCDTKLYYIPISPTNPLKPGSVQFQVLSSDGCANVQPKVSQEIILYANAGANSMMAIVASGAYYRPFNTKNLSEFHAHLFNGITTIAVPTADGTFNERYAYVMNGNGSIVVGKYSLDDVTTVMPKIGWGPWSGAGTVSWVSAWNAAVYFTSIYFGVGVCEVLDDAQYLDCALNVNAPTAPFVPPTGKGPLWFIPGQSVTLMDQVTRAMGTYQIDVNGFIVPQNNGGENLAIASLVAGQPWTGIIEPFCPDANPGTDVGQRMFKRRVSRFAAYVENSTGFLMARLFSGPITPATQAAGIVLGTIMNTHRVTTWNQGDDATKPPPLRETAERWRPIGRAFDPRVAVIKDTPGPLLIAELGIECTI